MTLICNTIIVLELIINGNIQYNLIINKHLNKKSNKTKKKIYLLIVQYLTNENLYIFLFLLIFSFL